MKTLTVEELIKKLDKWDPKLPAVVGVPNAAGDVYGKPITAVECVATDSGMVVSIGIEA